MTTTDPRRRQAKYARQYDRLRERQGRPVPRRCVECGHAEFLHPPLEEGRKLKRLPCDRCDCQTFDGKRHKITFDEWIEAQKARLGIAGGAIPDLQDRLS